MAGEDLNPEAQDEVADGEPTPDEGQRVPLKVVLEERRKRQSLETQLAELRGKVDGFTAGNRQSTQDATPKELNAHELRQAVDEGKLTEAEAEQIRERQIARKVTADVRKDLETEFSQRQLFERVGKDIGRFKEAIPDLADTDSAAFGKLRREFENLVGLGYDTNDPRTELLAARAAFGDPDKLKPINSKPRETYQETGGSAEPDDGGTRKDGAPKGLSQRERDFYKGQIDKGLYKGWDDPVLKKELGYRRPARQERAA